jgi:hypothetical protein
MIRCAEAWEWAYFIVIAVLLVFSLWHETFGIPRLLAGFMLVPMVSMLVGGLFIIDGIRRRAEQPWL